MSVSASLPIIASGDWQRQDHLSDYRYEWLNDMLVERATWDASAPQQQLGAVTIAGPGYIWFRFWLAEGDRIVDKYFDPQGAPIGMYAHVGMGLPHHGRGFSMVALILGLWITDSDDDKTNADAPDTLRYYDVEYNYATWQMVNYYGTNDWHVLDVLALKSVPEPASLLVLAIGGAAILRRRKAV